MIRSPRVSVIIPTYNRFSLLTEAIESVLCQSYRDFEVVVCDDGSSDQTALQASRFASPVRYLALEHSGFPGATRNRGIEAANGQLIAFLDDDDLWETSKLARQVAVIDQSPDLTLVYTDRRVRAVDGTVSAHIHTPPPASPDRLLELVLNGDMPFMSTLLVQRELLLGIGGFDEKLITAEDLDLLLRLSPGARAAAVPEASTLVRRQARSVSDLAGARTIENAIGVLERWRTTGALCPPLQRAYRRLLGRLHGELANALCERGDFAGCCRSALQAVRYSPARRSSWTTPARALLSAIAAR
jgi:glycosyltransferase involved in cell wall biosynthesis